MSSSAPHEVVRRRGLRTDLDGPNAVEEAEGWQTAYLDVITLMLTFFVVLLAFSDFRMQGPAPEPIAEESPVPAAGRDEAYQLPFPEPTAGIDLVIEDDRVSFHIRDHLLFRSGEADLKPAGLEVLREILPTLSATSHPISIEGHTDNVPIARAPFPSNWELSGARAASVVRQLIDLGLAPERMRAIGYGDTRPVGNNATLEGRSQNRRVGLILHLDPERDQLRATP